MIISPDKVISVAFREEGYLEKSKAAYSKDKDIVYEKSLGAGSDNITKYGIQMHSRYPQTMDLNAAWCDCFVDWCFAEAYGIDKAKELLCGRFDDYTVASAQLFKNAKRWITKNPVPGDQVFFKNEKRILGPL